MALDLKAACGSVVRPDIAPRTITIRAGVHTGLLYAVCVYFVNLQNFQAARSFLPII